MEHPEPAHKLSANLYDICHCCVYSKKTPDDGQRNCPEHVDFDSKNRSEKSVHLVGFIIRNLYLIFESIVTGLAFIKRCVCCYTTAHW